MHRDINVQRSEKFAQMDTSCQADKQFDKLKDRWTIVARKVDGRMEEADH